MAGIRFDQINIVVPDVVGASDFLRALGVEVPEMGADWADWAPHHVQLPTVADGFDADLDSSAFATHWGGLPEGFNGVVVNLRVDERADVDSTFDQALGFGASALHTPYDAFWGSRFAVVKAPGPLMVGIMSEADEKFRGPSPAVSDFA